MSRRSEVMAATATETREFEVSAWVRLTVQATDADSAMDAAAERLSKVEGFLDFDMDEVYDPYGPDEEEEEE